MKALWTFSHFFIPFWLPFLLSKALHDRYQIQSNCQNDCHPHILQFLYTPDNNEIFFFTFYFPQMYSFVYLNNEIIYLACSLLVMTNRFSHLASIRRTIWISMFQRILYDSISRTVLELCIYLACVVKIPCAILNDHLSPVVKPSLLFFLSQLLYLIIMSLAVSSLFP